MKERFKKIFFNLDENIGSIILVLVVAITSLNVFLRYLFGFVIVPAEELVLLLFCWAVYFGVAVGYRKGTHITIDSVYNILPQPIKNVLDVLIDLIIVTSNLYITYLSVILCASSGLKRTPILMLSYYFVYSSLIVGFSLSTIFSLIEMFRNIKKKLSRKELGAE